ncbi:MAG: hypothetical protein QOI34_1435 [Verrucomicrobiota bacterium]
MKIVLALLVGALGIGLDSSALAQTRLANEEQSSDTTLRSAGFTSTSNRHPSRKRAFTAAVRPITQSSTSGVSFPADTEATPAPTTLPLNNGDFETPPFTTLGTVAGWTTGGTGKVADIDQGATSGTHSAALSAGGDYEGDILSQRFFTTAGCSYKLDFDAAIYGEPDPSSALQQLRIQVVGDSFLLDVTLTDLESAHNFVQSAVPWKHYQFMFTANSSVTTLQFTDIGLGNVFADVVIDTVSVQPMPLSFADWQAAHFAGEPGISGWSADPDLDGIPNGLEYFFQTNPRAGIPYSERDFLPHVSIESTGPSQYLTFTYRRLINWTGNPEVVGVSNDLQTWDETQSQIEQVGSPVPMADGCTELVKVRLKTPINQGPIPRKFLRVKLTE